MKKLSIILSSMALLAVAGLFVAGCSSSTSPATASVGIPSNILMQSQSANSIAAGWTRAANDTGAAGIDTMIVMNGTTVAGTATAAAGVSTASVSGLSTGTVYSIIIASSGGRSASVSWMTAVRTNGLQLYQFSSNNPSGLQLNGPGGSATVISATSANSSVLDFYLEDAQHDNTITTPSGISFEGAQFLNGGGSVYRNSYMDQNDNTYIVGGLNASWSATNFAMQIDSINNPTFQGNAYDIPNDASYNTKGSRVLLVETTGGYFARIEVIPDPSTGMLYSGSGTDKYITVNVSYQPTANEPYAARGHQPFLGRPLRVLVP